MIAAAAELTAALAAEEAAIFAYPPIGVRLTGAAVTQAREAESAHRDRRDALLLRLGELGTTPSPAAASYALPYAITDRAKALGFAIEIEERVAAVWRAALGPTSGADRATALNALTDCAVRATRFRLLAKVSPATVPFPGRPG